jgi:nucleoside-diphosphate-sugar epimerase
MKIVVIGGTGLIGSKIIVLLRSAGHHALAETGVNAVTGEGLATVLRDAAVIVDLANSRSFEPSAAMDFFTAHEKNSTSPTDVLSRGPS